MNPGASPAEVGQQLAGRRDALDLTQEDLAERIGINARTVSAAERGANAIIKGKRRAWEEALGLLPGTISRAYRDGSPIDPVDEDLSTRGDQIRTTEDHLEESEEILAELRERLERLSPRRRRAVLHVVRELGEEETNTG